MSKKTYYVVKGQKANKPDKSFTTREIISTHKTLKSAGKGYVLASGTHQNVEIIDSDGVNIKFVWLGWGEQVMNKTLQETNARTMMMALEDRIVGRYIRQALPDAFPAILQHAQKMLKEQMKKIKVKWQWDIYFTITLLSLMIPGSAVVNVVNTRSIPMMMSTSVQY